MKNDFQSLILSNEQINFAERFASGESIEMLSMEFGRTIHSLRRWLQIPEVQSHIREIRRQSVSMISGKLVDLSIATIDRLKKLVNSECEAIALSAAKTVISSLIQIREHEHMVGRLEELKEDYERLKSKEPVQIPGE